MKRSDAPSVVIIVEDLPVPFDRRVWQEANTLRDAGWEVSVICPTGLGHDSLREDLDGIHIYRHVLPPEISSVRGYLREYTSALLAERRLLKQIARERGFHVIHLCNPPDVLFLNTLGYKIRHGVRVVFDHHDRNPELYVAKYGRKDFFYYALMMAERLTFATADVVIATNETHRTVALTRGHKRPEDVFVVRSSPSRDMCAGLVRSGSGTSSDGTPVVGYLGVMGEQDGVDLLLRAAAYVTQDRLRDVRFELIGGGPAYEDLLSLADEMGLEESVTFMGYRNRQESHRILSGCTVGVGPDPKNPYNDGCTMNKVLEYMALGKALVQFDLEEGRRTAGDASLYAYDNDPRSLGDAILDLIDDRGLRERLGAEGLRRFEDLCWENQVEQLMAAYDRVRSDRR